MRPRSYHEVLHWLEHRPMSNIPYSWLTIMSKPWFPQALDMLMMPDEHLLNHIIRDAMITNPARFRINYPLHVLGFLQWMRDDWACHEVDGMRCMDYELSAFFGMFVSYLLGLDEDELMVNGKLPFKVPGMFKPTELVF